MSTLLLNGASPLEGRRCGPTLTIVETAFGAANTNLIFGVLATIFLTAAGLLQIFFKNDYLQDKCKEGQEQDANDVVMSEHGP